MELRLALLEGVCKRQRTDTITETHSECYAGGWSRGRRKSGDPVPHRLARAQPTSLHCLSPGAVECGHKGPDELWN